MIPPVSHPGWRLLVTGKTKYQPTLLAMQIMMTRVNRAVKADPSPATVNDCVNDVYDFFAKYEKIAGDDLAQIFS